MEDTTFEKPTEGVIHGSNLLLGIFENDTFIPLAYSKTCSIQNKSETKDRATKNTPGGGKWKEKSVSGQSVSISAEGFNTYDANGMAGSDKLYALWEAGKPIEARYCHRGEEATKYRKGQFIITAFDETAPADDDATYSLSLENSGKVETVTPSASQQQQTE